VKILLTVRGVYFVSSMYTELIYMYQYWFDITYHKIKSTTQRTTLFMDIFHVISLFNTHFMMIYQIPKMFMSAEYYCVFDLLYSENLFAFCVDVFHF